MPNRFSPAPGQNHQDLTPDDETLFDGEDGNDPPFRSLFVGTGGTVVFWDADGNEASWKVVDGFLIPMVCTCLREGTDAEDIVGIR